MFAIEFDKKKGGICMIKFENTEVVGWEAAIRGMRNPMNSWEKSDSNCLDCPCYGTEEEINGTCHEKIQIGPNDHDLMMKLAAAGTDHRKFMRMIVVYVDITAPLYFFKELDTYKVGTVANSCSTMHKIAEKEFTLEDFSCEHLDTGFKDSPVHLDEDACISTDTGDLYMDYDIRSKDLLEMAIKLLNVHRKKFIETKNKDYWWQMIQLLPSSYNQKRTVMLNYEVLANIYKSRKNHKLSEWGEDFISWIKTLPYSELITGCDVRENRNGEDKEKPND